MNENNHTINIFNYSKKGILNETYAPLRNLIKDGEIKYFTTSNLTYSLNNFVNIDTQLSYDDSINLILTNNVDTPRIINTQFRKLGNNSYEYLTREQGATTNLYEDENIKVASDLFLRSNIWPIIDLLEVSNNGILMGGNYTFYIKYGDEDFNETEIVSESGIISIFKGDTPTTISGTLLDERTSKSINLYITNLDPAFSKIYLYFSRETSDLNGINITKYYKITSPYTKNNSNEFSIIIDGYELIEEIGSDELFINYNYFSTAKTQAVVQNMLFLGNLGIPEKNNQLLQQLSYKIKTTLKQRERSIGYVNSNYSVNIFDNNNEYYDPKNIYYYLGYWPDEFYKLGICYILNDNSTTNVFPLYGGSLKLNMMHSLNEDITNVEINTLLNKTTLENTGGVFKLPKVQVIDHNKKGVYPLYFEFNIDEDTLNELKKYGVIGYFFVRAKRIPTSLFQGLSMGVDSSSGISMPYVSIGVKNQYVAESFLTALDGTEDNSDKTRVTSRILEDNINSHIREFTNEVEYSSILSLDPIINYQLRNILSWHNYKLEAEYSCKIQTNWNSRLFDIFSYIPSDHKVESSLVFVNENLPSVWIEGKYFSTRAGNAENVNDFSILGGTGIAEKTEDRLMRGIYSPIIGTNTLLNKSTIYTVKNNIKNDVNWITNLLNNNHQYFSITNRYKIPENITSNVIVNAYRGDCFTNTVTIRLNRNFIDPTFPANNKIIDKYTWRDNFNGTAETKMLNTETASDNKKDKNEHLWNNINLGDLNTVPLGQWLTFKCLSNYNLGLRSIDKSDVGLMGRLGSEGNSFYPISGFNVSSSGKMSESQVLNEGYNITLSRKSYNKWTPTPYENWNFENRIAFSNIASTKMFTNGFKVFQGLAYQDVDKQFGQIVKLFPYAQNLLCVFEHGLAIIPINEKALLSTQEGLSIHLYGAGVLQEQVSVISPDYGSTWMESLIKTPEAYYGVDTSAKKIWKFNNTEGFQCISDFKVQSFLNDNLSIDWNDKFFMGATNVRTHYNNFKGDVIFTFYNKDDAYSLCYNERMKMWVSRYSWMPLLSANIDNYFYSFDRDLVAKYTNICAQTEKQIGIICEKPFYNNEQDIKLIYKNTLPNVTIKLESCKFGNQKYEKNDIFTPIIANNEICGMYYMNGINGFINEGGSIDKTNDDLTLWRKPLKWCGKQKIILYLQSKEDVISDMIPNRVFVYCNNNQRYITHTSPYNWQSLIPDSHETNWWYIAQYVDLKIEYDSDGNIWETGIITDGWSTPKKYNAQNFVENNWKQISEHGVEDSLIDIDKNLFLGNCYLSNSNKIGNFTYTSSVPIIIYEESGEESNEEIDINFIDHELCSAYVYNDGTNHYLHLPSMFKYNNSEIVLKAYCEDQLLETYTLTIGLEFNDSLHLYKHDISSPICKWYEDENGNSKQHPFEYEFVVNQPTGYHKIFNNLMIISNNVEPESLEVEIVGDAYDYKQYFDNIEYKFPTINLQNNKTYYSKLQLDKVTNENRIIMHQDCLNIENFGRRLGNISYIEGKWYIVLQPIYYTQTDEKNEKNILKTTRLRDKWAKVRIKYSGEKLAIITAIQTLMNISYV